MPTGGRPQCEQRQWTALDWSSVVPLRQAGQNGTPVDSTSARHTTITSVGRRLALRPGHRQAADRLHGGQVRLFRLVAPPERQFASRVSPEAAAAAALKCSSAGPLRSADISSTLLPSNVGAGESETRPVQLVWKLPLAGLARPARLGSQRQPDAHLDDTRALPASRNTQPDPKWRPSSCLVAPEPIMRRPWPTSGHC